jgi:hypothetical protein
MSGLGHSRLMNTPPAVTGCPLRPESGQTGRRFTQSGARGAREESDVSANRSGAAMYGGYWGKWNGTLAARLQTAPFWRVDSLWRKFRKMPSGPLSFKERDLASVIRRRIAEVGLEPGSN